MAKNKLIFGVFLLIFLIEMNFSSAEKNITGIVNDALDGTSANGLIITIWNPLNGLNDNVTDIIGSSGNSGVNNHYLFNCELLSAPCVQNDNLSIKVFSSLGNKYLTEVKNITVSASPEDTADNLTLNSPPNITLVSPVNFANSSSPLNLSCLAKDLDSNLNNASLWANWSFGWHLNQSLSLSGNSSNVTFQKSLSEGRYIWGCSVTDNLSVQNISSLNYTLTIDNTPPNINSFTLNESFTCGTLEYIRTTCISNDTLTGVESVTIESLDPSNSSQNFTTTLLSGTNDTFYSDIQLSTIGVWNFRCASTDFSNNSNTSSWENIKTHPNESEITSKSPYLSINNLDATENEVLTLNSTILNDGCTQTANFTIAFYFYDLLQGKLQLGFNQTLNLAGRTNTSVNTIWNAVIGENILSIELDIDDNVTEYNESNNIYNNTFSINSWQSLYGEITLQRMLRSSKNDEINFWSNDSTPSGNIFITSSENFVSWNTLIAIGKFTNMTNSSDDFSDIDNLLNMSNFNDSVKSTFSSDGINPNQTTSFLISQKQISQVPIINSGNTSNFITGLLWDYSDDVLDEGFSIDDKEDLVFAAKVNKQKQGSYGIYDYEITIPVRLRSYSGPSSQNIYLYYDLT